MTDLVLLFQDIILRILETAPRSLNLWNEFDLNWRRVEQLPARIEIVRALAQMNERQLVQLGTTVQERVVETRMKDPESGRMIRAGDQKTIIATFTHETSRNLDPQLHTHAVIANMMQRADGKWRTMANEKLYGSKMLIGARDEATRIRHREDPCRRAVRDRGGDGRTPAENQRVAQR